MHIDEAPDPIDRCVYPRPFPPEFTGCRAYQPVTFLAADSRNQPLGSWFTCRHLVVGKHVAFEAGFYPRCGLGTGADRMRWLSLVGPAWADVVRALQEDFDEFIKPYRDSLFALKAKLLDTRNGAVEELRAELQVRLGEFLQATRSFLEERRERFAEVGMPVGPLMELVEEWATAWVRSPSPGQSRGERGPAWRLRTTRPGHGGAAEPTPGAHTRRRWSPGAGTQAPLHG